MSRQARLQNDRRADSQRKLQPVQQIGRGSVHHTQVRSGITLLEPFPGLALSQQCAKSQ